MPESIAKPETPHHRVRILTILGDRQGIDIEADRQLLANLPQTDVVFLVEPSRQEVYSHLWEQTWDILFFMASRSLFWADLVWYYCKAATGYL
jgi:hypothetical protein